MKTGLQFTVAAAALALGAQPALAQPEQPGGPSVRIEEVVITAQRREETIQKSSLSIQAISPGQLQDAGVVQPKDLAKLVPGLNIVAAGITTQVYLRGVGDFGATSIANPSLPFNIDGVVAARSGSVAGKFFDLDRVEVLKGPQGTLYGRNASGGAINLLTKKPQLGELGGYFLIGGGNYNAISSEGAVNIPVGQKLALRAGYQVAHRDGYLSDGGDDDKHQSGRLQVLYKPNEDISLLLGADYTHVGGKGASNVLLPHLAGTDPWTGLASPQVNAYLQTLTTPALPPGTPFMTPLDPNKIRQDIHYWSAHADLEWNLGFATLTVLPAYQQTKAKDSFYPSAFLYDVGEELDIPETSNATSVETRLSNSTERLKWVAGLYYYREKQSSSNLINSGILQNIGGDSKFRSESFAGFGQATLSVTQRVRLIGGLRYTSDERSLSGGVNYYRSPSVNCANGPPPTFGTPGLVCTAYGYSGKRTFYRVNWKAGMEVDLAPENMLYFSAGTGFKSGGFNQSIGVRGVPGVADGYGPEQLTAYTLGSKNRFLDGRLQVNLEAFFWDYKDSQTPGIAVDAGGFNALLVRNAGKAQIYGLDLDIQAKITRRDRVFFSVEYLESKYENFKYDVYSAFVTPGTGCTSTPTGSVHPQFGPLLTQDCSGFELNRAPKWAGTAGYTHTFDLGNAGSLDLTGDTTFETKRWISTDFVSAYGRAPGYVLLNASLKYTDSKDRFSLTAFVRNMTEQRVYSAMQESPQVHPFSGAVIGAPRTYGATLGVKF